MRMTRRRWTGRRAGELVRLSKLVVALIAIQACGSPTDPNGSIWDSTWPVWSVAEDAGFSTAGLAQVASYAESLNTTGLVVVAGGQVLHSQGNVTELTYVASVRKSILSILYGRYVADGTIDLDATLGELGLDDESGLLPLEKQATVRDLITARSGVYHPASNDGDDSGAAPARGSQQPGEYFLYNNWDFNAAGAVFELVTGRAIYDALRDDLSVPLGMEDFDRGAQKRSGDLTISRYPAYHMWLSTRDLARIGELMLRKGRWDGVQLVPADWIKSSTSAITPLAEMNPESRRGGSVGFGMMWWVWDGPAAVGAFEGAFTGAGAYGQYITVLPALDMVVAHKTAVGDGHGFGRRTLFSEYRGILERLAEAAEVLVTD